MIDRGKGTSPSGVGPFFARLRDLLTTKDADELRTRLVEYARRLDRHGREGLLRALDGPVSEAAAATAGEAFRDSTEARAKASDAVAPAEPTPDDEAGRLAGHPLLAEIDAFAKRIENNHYATGWGWDPDIRDEREFGDESWAPEMDALFAEADDAFLSGDRALAGEAYGALLEAFLLEEEAGTFCGPVSAMEMVETDVERAKARYFRCRYELAKPEQRPVHLLRAMAELRWVTGREIGLEAVADADAGALPEFDSFLDAWVDELEAPFDTDVRWAGYGWPRYRKWLSREAAELRAGTTGLEELAHRRGASDPEAYHRWIDRLLDEDRREEALRAARTGTAAVKNAAEQARLADATAVLAADATEPEWAVEARRVAWRAEPTGRRLVALAGSVSTRASESEPADADPEGTALAELRSELARLRERSVEIPARVAAALELLAGEFDAAVRRIEETSPSGWIQADHPGYVVFPFLLAAGTRPVALKGAAAEYVGDLDRDVARDALAASLRFDGPVRPDSELEIRLRREVEYASPDFSEVLGWALDRQPPDERERRSFLAVAESVARDRVEAIVSNKRRQAYASAARVATAAAEAWSVAGEEERGSALLTELRNTFSRYYAFTGELRQAVKGSPVVRDVAKSLE